MRLYIHMNPLLSSSPKHHTSYSQLVAMASKVCLVLAIVAASLFAVRASDPDILSDFVLPPGSALSSSSFTFTGLRSSLFGAPADSSPFKVTKVTLAELPILSGLSVSLASLQFAPSGINPPHTHPRASELLVVVQGRLNVGVVDSTNKLFTQVLNTGDVFVFPKGLVHFQMNADSKYPAFAISAFGSANAGTIPIAKTVFGSGIDEGLLAKAFKTDAATIEKLVSANKS